MAALTAGVQYDLSSYSNFDENKSLIFVKLTDSAQRAIEDYLRNRDKINQNPTIEFVGNEGKLSFPSTKSSHGNFTFSLSNNQDIEGPQGGFECIQQTGPKNLQSVGTLPCKMRIHANDDIYETTRHRMHVAEENNKNKCTRVIKANDSLGKKVKLKGSVRAIPPSVNTTVGIIQKHREPSVPTSSNQTSKFAASQKTVSVKLANRSQTDTQKKITDIMRRPIKERLIHLLALRSFKRPELYDRITKDGIREKEKNVVATVLKQIAFMRGNTYHLNKSVWNDVQEDWPFYTDQEKEMLKLRKSQTLTRRGSSDEESSGSGLSPNLTRPGSPSTIAAPPSTLLSQKRPADCQGNDGLPTKRPRTSRYRKPDSICPSNVDNTKSNVSSSISNCLDKKDSDDINTKVVATETITSHMQIDKERETEQYSESENLPLESSSSDQPLNNFVSTTVEENSSSFFTSSCNRISLVSSGSVQTAENPDYLTCFTKISSAEQRKRYKAEFHTGFEEYRILLDQVQKIREKFIQLEEELKNKQNAGNVEGIEAIAHTIKQEYAKRRSVYARYYYLHDKLGHIKKLVSDYDAGI